MIMKLIPMILKLLDQGNLNLNRFRRNLLGLRKMKKVMALTVKILKVLFNRINNLKKRIRKGKLPKVLQEKNRKIGDKKGEIEEEKEVKRKVIVTNLIVKVLLL